jgi:hypothetical protein
LCCFVTALPTVSLALVFEGDTRCYLLVGALFVGAIGLKLLSIWYLLYGGYLNLMEALLPLQKKWRRMNGGKR